MLWLILVAGFFAVFLLAVWRMSSGPSNEGPELGNNLPPQIVFPGLQGPEPGTPESIHPVESRRGPED